MKDEKREKAKLLPKQIKEIPKDTPQSTNKNNMLKKKCLNSISSNNEIFLKSNSGFQKSKHMNEFKSIASNSQGKPKPEGCLIEYFTPKELMEKFGKFLNTFEQEEIFLFQEIYYCGKFLKNKQQMMKIESNSNLGSSLARNNTSTNEEDKNINIK